MALKVGPDANGVIIMTNADESVAPMIFGSYADMARYFAWCSDHANGTILNLDGASLRVGLMMVEGED